MNMYDKKINWNEEELATLKRRIMRRVYLAWLLKRIVLPAFLVLPVAGFIFLQELSNFHLRVIVENTYRRILALDAAGLLRYFFAAIRETERDALMVALSSFLLAAFFARRLIRELIAFASQNSALNAAVIKEKHS